MVMSLMPKFLIRQSYFRLVASLSGVFLVFQGLVWVLVSSIIEETLWEANIAELYSLTLELERGHLHDHGGAVLWGVRRSYRSLDSKSFHGRKKRRLLFAGVRSRF